MLLCCSLLAPRQSSPSRLATQCASFYLDSDAVVALRNDNNLQSWRSWDCKVGHNNNTMLTCYPHFIFLADMISFYYYACSWTNIVSLLLSVTSSLFAQEVHFAVYELDFTDCENKHAELCLRWPGHTSRGMGSADIELTRPGPCFSYKTSITCDFSSVYTGCPAKLSTLDFFHFSRANLIQY